jgi:hypothetical protein
LEEPSRVGFAAGYLALCGAMMAYPFMSMSDVSTNGVWVGDFDWDPKKDSVFAAILTTIHAAANLIGLKQRPERNQPSGRGAVLRTIINLTNTAITWSAFAIIQQNLITHPCTNEYGSLQCTSLAPSDVQTCQSLLVTAGILNIFATCRTLYSAFRCE